MKSSVKKFICLFVIIFAAEVEMCAAEMTRADSLLKARKHFSFALQYKKAKKYKLAIEQYKKSIAFNDTVYQVHFSHADLLMTLKRPLEARREYLKSLSLNPRHYKSAAVLLKLYYKSAQYDSALVMYEVMHRIKPNPEILTFIGNLKEYLGKKAEALETYTKLVENGNRSLETLTRASSLSRSLGDLERARQFISLALKEYPGESNILRLAAQISLSLNDYSSATYYFSKLAEVDSTDISVLTKLEKLYRIQGNTENLLLMLERHHRLSPEDAGVLIELAELSFSEGEKSSGLSYVKKGLKISPSEGKLHILLGEYYHDRGEMKKALYEYKKACNDLKWRSRALELIQRIERPETEEKKVEREFFKRGQ